MSVGYRRQDLTFVYVKDVVQAVFRGIERGVTGRAYFLSDGQVYASRTFSDLIRRELGNPLIVPDCSHQMPAVSIKSRIFAGRTVGCPAQDDEHAQPRQV